MCQSEGEVLYLEARSCTFRSALTWCGVLDFPWVDLTLLNSKKSKWLDVFHKVSVCESPLYAVLYLALINMSFFCFHIFGVWDNRKCPRDSGLSPTPRASLHFALLHLAGPWVLYLCWSNSGSSSIFITFYVILGVRYLLKSKGRPHVLWYDYGTSENTENSQFGKRLVRDFQAGSEGSLSWHDNTWTDCQKYNSTLSTERNVIFTSLYKVWKWRVRKVPKL